MRPVVRRVQIDGDPPHPPPQATPMPLDHARRQLPGHPVERAAARAVLEPRDRWLRRQGRAGHGVSPKQQLVDGILRQVVGVVAVGMTARDAEDPLSGQLRERVSSLLGSALVGEAPGKRLDEAVHALGRLEQDAAAVGTRLLAAERRDKGFVEEIGEQDSL